MDIAIVGGTAVDLIFPRLPRLPRWPRHTEFTSANLLLVREPPIVTLGGNGANAAYVAARCGACVTLHTQLGDDAMGCLVRAWLAEAGCHLQTPPNRSATSVNVTAANARQQRATFYWPGARVSTLPKLDAPHVVLVCGAPHPPLNAIARGFRQLHESGSLTALDAGPILEKPWRLEELNPVFAHLDLFIANEYELQRIAGRRSLGAAAKALRESFEGEIVVKRGGRGASWVPRGETAPQHFSGRAVRVRNTIGAGDSFNGALLAALAAGATLPDAIRRACTTAASVVRSPRGVLGVEAGTG